MNVKEVLENDPGAYFIHDELLAPLKVMYSSLQNTGDDSIANARLLDCMRQVCSISLFLPLASLLHLSFVYSTLFVSMYALSRHSKARQRNASPLMAPSETALVSCMLRQRSVEGEVRRCWLQVQCFGLGMVKLDIRQESARHSDVLDTITQYLGLGSYK